MYARRDSPGRPSTKGAGLGYPAGILPILGKGPGIADAAIPFESLATPTKQKPDHKGRALAWYSNMDEVRTILLEI